MDASRKPRVRGKRSDYIGVTSDGVWIPRPPKGPRNLTDKQVRQIVDELHRRMAARHKSQHDA
jgi:hypothetical protein